MHILFLSEYFDPEPVLKGMGFVQEMVRQGHSVEVLTGFPNYPEGRIYPGYRLRLIQREEVAGVRVLRVPLYPSHNTSGFARMLTFSSFALSAAILGPWVVQKPDVIYVCHGNGTIGLPAWTLKVTRGAPFVLDIQDLWPDSVVASGMLPRGLKPLLPVLEAWCRFIYRQAAQVAVLSQGFKRTLTSRGVPEAKVSVIPNWCDEVQIRPGPVRPEEEALLEGRFNVVMAGNMGKMQGLSVVLEAAAVLQGIEPKVQFVLVGSGVDLPRLEAQAASLGLTNVLFLPRRPVGEIGALLNRADALLVHLKDDPLFSITIPSRIQAYLAVGRPILCGVRGDATDLVLKAQAGLAFEPERSESLVASVCTLLRLTPESRAEMGERGRRFYRDVLSIQVGTAAFLELFTRALRGPSEGGTMAP